MTVTLVVAGIGAWRTAAAVERVATRMFPGADPAPRLAAQLTLGALVVFLLGAWAWLDPALTRAGFGALGRFAASSLACLVGTVWIVTVPTAWVGFFALLDVPGARSALTVLLVTLATPLLVWVPAFWSGELLDALRRRHRRARRSRGNAGLAR